MLSKVLISCLFLQVLSFAIGPLGDANSKYMVKEKNLINLRDSIRQTADLNNNESFKGVFAKSSSKKFNHKYLSEMQPDIESGRRKKRNLGGINDPFRPRLPPYNSNKNTFNNLSHFYAFSGPQFMLNGSANIVYSKGKLRIIFDYNLNGFANASIQVVTKQNPSTFKYPPSSQLYKTKPRNCHLQNEQNSDLTLDKNRRCLLKNDMFKSKQEAKKISMIEGTQPNRQIPGNSNNLTKIEAPDCLQPAVRYVKSWLCFNSKYLPCFSVYVQGKEYKITEKICPNQSFVKSNYYDKLIN